MFNVSKAEIDAAFERMNSHSSCGGLRLPVHGAAGGVLGPTGTR